MSIRCLQKLLYEIQKWPGVGPKSAQKLAAHLLKNKNSDIPALITALQTVLQSIRQCSQCFGWMEGQENKCCICQNLSRDSSILCVVENPFDILRIENSHIFQGYYHVLYGLISPINNTAPEDLTVNNLIKKVESQNIQEIILALDTHLEGDTTALYLAKHLKPFGVKISRPAEGIPLGSHIDFIDDQTLSQAIENRKEI